jgi:replication initiation and membrane attachment protein DnaB
MSKKLLQFRILNLKNHSNYDIFDEVIFTHYQPIIGLESISLYLFLSILKTG